MSLYLRKLKEEVSDFTTIWGMVFRMKVNLNQEVNLEKGAGTIVVVVSTGIKVTNRG